jgi:hypothetical protein
MSDENVEIVRRSIDAYNRRDLEALRLLDDPNVEVDWSVSRGVEAGVYQGIDAVQRFYRIYLYQETAQALEAVSLAE